MKYIVKYHDVVIGTYNKIKEDYVEYIVDKKGIETLEKQGYAVYPDLTKDFSGKGFPFFDNRIRNCSRFEGVEIGYHTDPVTLVEVK